MIPSAGKGQHACQQLKSTLATSSSSVGVSPPSSSSLPAFIFSRRQVLWSFSGVKIAASKADEAAGLSPGNEDNEAGGHFGPEKPYCPLFTEDKDLQEHDPSHLVADRNGRYRAPKGEGIPMPLSSLPAPASCRKQVLGTDILIW